MTAGLHHRWRARAVELGGVGPGSRVIDVATGTGDLAIALARAVRPRRRGRRLRLLRADARARPRARRRSCASNGPTRCRCPTPATASTPRPSASARATSPTCGRGIEEMVRVVRPGGRVVILEITQPDARAARRLLPALVRPHRAVARPPRRRRAPPTATCRARSRASRRRASSRRVMDGCGLRRDPLRAHGRRHHRDPRRRGGRERRRSRTRSTRSSSSGASRCAPRWRASRRACARSRRSSSTRSRPSPPAASGCGRCSCSSPGSAASAQEALSRAAAAVELIHSATLVHDDVLDDAPLRRGRRPSSPPPAAAPRPPPATCSSRARSPSCSRNGADRAAARAVGRVGGARPRRADAARRRLARGRHARALPRALRAEDGAAVRGRRASSARSSAGGPPLGPFGHAVGLAFQLLDDVLDVTGPAERTGKRRGTDLLDGTVTLPLILARERSPELAALDLRAIADAAEAERICEAIEATGAAERARAARARARGERQARAAGAVSAAPAARCWR